LQSLAHGLHERFRARRRLHATRRADEQRVFHLLAQLSEPETHVGLTLVEGFRRPRDAACAVEQREERQQFDVEQRDVFLPIDHY